jgi:5-methyltetrahydrofolate--homocysteine methyltransferase
MLWTSSASSAMLVLEDLLLLRQRQSASGERLPLFFLCDGAMGTELVRRGADPSGCLELLSLTNPALVSSIHADYRAAGADLLTTNSFGANSCRLRPYGMDRQVEQINRAAVQLARNQANGALVIGSVGPTGVQDGSLASESMRAVFREQATVLDAAGVDLFACETFGDVVELRAAILGIRDVSERPIFAQMTYTVNGRTPLGLTPSQVVDELSGLPVAAIGVNCAIGVDTTLQVMQELGQATDLPIIARPNAGEPVFSSGVAGYPIQPDEFAALLHQLAALAVIVGGCCGTTPEHISATRDYSAQEGHDSGS